MPLNSNVAHTKPTMTLKPKSNLTANSHAKRLGKWRNLASPQARYLIDQVIERLVPVVEASGFERIELSLMGPDHTPSGSEIRLERVVGKCMDTIIFNFEKHRTPRFQIHGARRLGEAPFPFIRAANLVRSKSQYYCFWGKPWWFPIKLWPASATECIVKSAGAQIGALVHFLETGERRDYISKEVVLSSHDLNR